MIHSSSEKIICPPPRECWYMAVIPALEKLKQENHKLVQGQPNLHNDLKASLGYKATVKKF